MKELSKDAQQIREQPPVIKVINQKKQLELLTATTTPQQVAQPTSKSQLERRKPVGKL